MFVLRRGWEITLLLPLASLAATPAEGGEPLHSWPEEQAHEMRTWNRVVWADT